jgi:hypothetical protein
VKRSRNADGKRQLQLSGRLRACDDATVRLFLRVSERRLNGKRVVAAKTVGHWLEGPSEGGCKRYARSWNETGKLARRGKLVVQFRVRDVNGAWSAPVRPPRRAR